MDRYTRTVLTVIAVSLTTIAIENLGNSTARAAGDGVMKVQICDQRGFFCANISGDKLDVHPDH